MATRVLTFYEKKDSFKVKKEKNMKKNLFLLTMTALLSACVQHNSEEVIFQEGQPVNFNAETVYLTAQDIQVQPDEELEALKTIKELPVQKNDKLYTDSLSKKLRKELRSTGIQVKETAGQIDLIIPNKLAFGNNQTQFSSKFEEAMNSVVQLLQEYDETMIQIIGYTDDLGSVLANNERSLDKAEKLADFLKKQGVEPARIITDGAGSDNPVATNSTPAGREQNRRIEMTLISLH